MQRPRHLEALDSLIDLGVVIGTSIGEAASSVIARLRGNAAAESDDDDDGAEELDAEVWGEPNILSRPLDSNDDGEPEAIFVRRADSREIIGMRDRRYQVSLEQGEVVIRNIVADPSKRATVKIDQDGTITATGPKVVLASNDIRSGSASATEIPAWVSKVFAELTKIHATLASLSGGALSPAVFTVPYTPPSDASDLGGTKTKVE